MKKRDGKDVGHVKEEKKTSLKNMRVPKKQKKKMLSDNTLLR